MEGSYKYRVKFKKTGCMKFLGHLDVLRYFQKAIKRSGIPIAYSEGFNPHQLLSFAAPLSVGVESGGEYFDMELLSEVPENEIVKSLDDTMVEGVEIIDARLLSGKVQNAMAAVSAARYRIDCEGDNGQKIHDFISNASDFVIVKKTKKSEREIDLLPLIYECTFDDGVLRMTLPCGSTENIKPQLVIDSYIEKSGADAFKYSLYREELFMGEFPALKTLI